MPAHTLDAKWTPIGHLRPHPKNPRNGDTRAIAESLATNGQYRPIVVTSDGTILAGNHTYAAAMELGWTELSVVVLDLDPNSEQAHRIMLADNRTADLGMYDEALLLDLLQSVELPGTGYTDDDLAHLKHLVDDYFDDKPKPAVPKKGQLVASIDMIWSMTDPTTSLFAHLFGWKQGVISHQLPGAFERFQRIAQNYKDCPDRITFIDNEWHDYNHERHMTVVEQMVPKYATVRDVLTRKQAKDAGVVHFTLDETIKHAERVAAAGVPNVIFIPKFDCIKDIPTTIGGARVVLGYSVPSSYGRTNLDPEKFAGHPVHLLGGSWETQLSLVAQLGSDVVSLDNNMFSKTSRYGQVYVGRDKPTTNLSTFFDLPAGSVRGGYFLSGAISLYIAMAEAVHYGLNRQGDDEPLPDLAPERGQNRDSEDA